MSRENLILIIDDEVQIRRLLEITLQSNGFNICEALNGREGINLAASHQPELIILDIGLPDISGHEVLKKLREWYTNPVIILSVQSNEEDIVKALDSGANDYLVKPFRTGELLARIRSALRSNNNSEDTKAVFSIADIEIDFVARTVKKKNELISVITNANPTWKKEELENECICKLQKIVDTINNVSKVNEKKEADINANKSADVNFAAAPGSVTKPSEGKVLTL